MSKDCIINYTREEITEILKVIKRCVAKDRFTISQNDKRRENFDFISKYNLTVARVKDIIYQIEINDFCYGLPNHNSGFEHEILYVFCPRIELFCDDSFEAVDVYIKFNVVDGKRVIVISFHQRNFPIGYLFKRII